MTMRTVAVRPGRTVRPEEGCVAYTDYAPSLGPLLHSYVG